MQVELVAFTSKRGKVAITVPSSFSDNVLTVTQWIYSQAINGVLKNDEVEFQRLLVGQFSSKISKVSTGAMIEGKGTGSHVGLPTRSKGRKRTKSVSGSPMLISPKITVALTSKSF